MHTVFCQFGLISSEIGTPYATQVALNPSSPCFSLPRAELVLPCPTCEQFYNIYKIIKSHNVQNDIMIHFEGRK